MTQLLLATCLLASTPATAQEPPPPAEVLTALAAEYETNEKRYESLVKRVDKAVEKALADTTWQGERSLAEHPARVLIEALEAELLETATARKRRNGELQAALLERYPWLPEVEFMIGLHHGSDRPIPEHVEGFIHLGSAVGEFPGYPELLTNHYLYGLREVVHWQYLVETKRKTAFGGRGPKDPPVTGTSLPTWEALRVYLQGTTPDVPLFAIPQLTHRIHARLGERRAEEENGAAIHGRHPMDETLAFLDARWDGYSVELPYSDDRLPVVFPAHDLFADSQGFLFRFQRSAELHETGEMPFIGSPTNQLYGQLFHDVDLDLAEYNEPYQGRAAVVMAAFQNESVYLARYKTLISQLVRAVCAPQLAYPAAMAYLDYPDGRGPSGREWRDDLDVPRSHAVLVWAAVAKDPEAYADWLYDNVLSVEEFRFPSIESLATAFTLAVRERREELLALVAANDDPDFQREFSPYTEYLSGEGEPNVVAMLASFHAFHAPLEEAIRDAAWSVIQREID